MIIKNKLLDYINNIKFNELLSTLIGLSFTCSYLIFPVWLFPGSILFDFFIFIFLWILNISLVYFISPIIKKFEKEIINIIKDIQNYLKISAKILLVLFIVFILLFFEDIFLAPLESRGDEPDHVGRITRFILFWTVDNLIPNQISFLVILLSLFLIAIIFLNISKISQKKKENNIKLFNKRKSFLRLILVLAPIFVILLFLIAIEEYAPILFSKSLLSSFARYGPLHPSIYAIPVFIFGWSEWVIPIWRIMNLITSVSILFLSSYLVHLLYNHIQNKNYSRLIPLKKRIYLNYLIVLPIFFVPAIIRFTFSVWLTTGVIFFYTLSSIFILKYFIESSPKKKKALLLVNSLILGYGLLWKEILLLQLVIFVFLLIIEQIFFYIKKSSKNKKNSWNWVKTNLKFIIFGLVIGVPFIFFVQFCNLSGRAYQPEISFLFSIKLFDYFNRRYIEFGFMADIFYAFLLILIIFAFIKKQYHLLYFPFAFFIWYSFFTLDSGWAHTVDRFMNIPVSIIILSFAIVASNINILIKKPKIFNNIIRKKFIIEILVILIILIPTGFIGYNYVQEEKKKNRLPYNLVVNYVTTNWDNNSEKIYYYYGPNSLSFYFYIQGFPFWEMNVPAEPDEFSNVDEFLSYSFKKNIRFIILPDDGHVNSILFQTSILNQLINLGLNGTIKMVKFIYYESIYYVWDLRYTNFE